MEVRGQPDDKIPSLLSNCSMIGSFGSPIAHIVHFTWRESWAQTTRSDATHERGNPPIHPCNTGRKVGDTKVKSTPYYSHTGKTGDLSLAVRGSLNCQWYFKWKAPRYLPQGIPGICRNTYALGSAIPNW